MLNVGIPLVAVFAIFLLSPQIISANTSSSHPFILEWGESGFNSPGLFSFPQYLAIDENGNVYVTDLGNKRVQKFDSEGTFLKSWGSGGTGSGEFNSPAGIAVYDDFVFVVDNQLHRIQKFNVTGEFVLKWGSEGQASGQFLLPNDIAVDSNGTVYVVDTGNHRVQKFTPDGDYISEFGQGGSGETNLQSPIGIAIDDDNQNIYVSEPGNNRIVKFDSSGTYVEEFGPNAAGYSIMSQGITVDPLGNLYVADTGNDRIIRFDQTGLTLTTWGGMGTMAGQFKMPKDIALDSSGRVYVVDSYGHRIQKFGSPISSESANLNTQTTRTQTQDTQTSESGSQTTESTQVNPVPGDLTKPTIVPPNDLLIEATGGLTPVSVGKAMATDESGIQSLSSNAPAQFPLGVTTVIWTAIDGAGNMAIATQKVTVVDTVAPTISSSQEITIEAESTSNNSVVLNPPATSDAVGVVSIENDAPEVFPLGETIVSWTATDVAGNTASTTQIVRVVDTAPPTLYAPEDIVTEATSYDENEVYLGEATVIDNGEIVSVTNDAPQFFTLGNTTVNWMAADASGNIGTSQQLVRVIDTTSPQISAPTDVVFEATSEDENVVELGTPEVSDVQNVTITNDSPSVFPMGETRVTWQAVDPDGNIATASQMVTVVDTTPPTLTVPEDITLEAQGAQNNSVSLENVTAEDVSGIYSISHNAPEYFPLGTTIITWNATDNYGNSVTEEQTVTVVDTTPPEIIAPDDIIAEAVDIEQNFVNLGEGSVFDLIDVESVTNDAPESFPIGMTTITWTATDTSGNTASDTQVITVEDTTPPEIIIPDNLVVEATTPSGMEIELGQPTATDAIEIESISNNAPELFYVGDTSVTWTAVDTHGNTATAIQNVTIIDTTAPTITPPDDVVFEAEDPTSNTVPIGTATADDIVGVLSIENDAPDVFPVGETEVTWTASDAAGNVGTATQLVSVVDTTPPQITAPEDVTVEASSATQTVAELGNATVSDVIGIESVTNDAPEAFPVGETIVTWTANDVSGLSSTDTQIVNVVDTTPPTLTVPSTITVEATDIEQNVVEYGTITADDLVGVASIDNDAPDVFPFGLTTITWTVTDEAGNVATKQQKISVVDTTPPTIEPPQDVEVEASSANNNTVELGQADATDKVALDSITNDAPNVFSVGETVITWTATDSSGNSANVTQLVSVVDTTPPQITQPDDVVFEAQSENENSISLSSIVAEDSVSDVTVTNDAPQVFPLGETIVTWTATDETGNSANIEQKISVVDTSPPELTVPEDVIIDATSLETPVDIGEAVSVDLTDASPTISNDAPYAFPLGQTTVTWTTVDGFGNSVSKQQTITVQACGRPDSDYNTIMGTPGEDVIEGTDLGDLIFALAGDDIVIGAKGNDCIFGGEGEDIIFGNQGDDYILGDDGNDIIKGASGNDVIKGGQGLDVIDGGDDNDSCTIDEFSVNDLAIKCE